MLIAEQSAWAALRRTLQAMSDAARAPLKYVPNQGNAGDALISCGTWQFFDDCQVAPQYARTSEVASGDSVIYAGGGNLVPEYANCKLFLEQCLDVNVACALVMPHTIRGHEALLSRLDRRFVLVCRDVASLHRVRATNTRAQLMYAPDMALYVDVDRLFARCLGYKGWSLWAKFARSGRLWTYLRWTNALNRLRPPHGTGVEIFRADVESNLAAPGDPKRDLPSFYGSKYRFREEADLVGRDLLGYFKHVSRVRTNRLHIGVAGALMNCEVTYLDNSYGKIRAVYDAWLNHLPRVSFEVTV